MSLAEQRQLWRPTCVQVTVLQARGLRTKGKNGTNDAYAVMQVARDRRSTSVAEKSVAPVWKEEAAFELPGDAERCALKVSVMHRALVGPDKLLGMAEVNLLELSDNKSRNRSEWFKLMDKTGKPDKDRGEVLLDIQFMKNNMTASMYDLSGQDKSSSRLSKFKDKLKGKKKDGLSDSASAIVPSVGKILTDSEEEEEADPTPGTKKKNKLKQLFAPKALHRNMSQSMSTLPRLNEKDSAISLSRSSGLNVESPEAKKKFKLFKLKHTGSSDSKVSQSSGALGQGLTQSNLCINGSHVYTEEPENRDSRTGSTLSLNSSGHGSMEDLHNRKFSTPPVDLQTQENALEEMHRRKEEQRKQEEEVRKRLEEERMRQIEEEEREQLRREEKRRTEQEMEEQRRIEEEEKERNEKLARKNREQETARQEEERRRAEERLQKEKREAEEKRKRKEEEQIIAKKKEQLQLQKERMELKEKEENEKMRKKREEEEKKAEEERIRQEKDELEKQKKEQKNISDRPDVKPRSARMSAAKKAEKPDATHSEYFPSTSPVDDMLLDETSINLFDQSLFPQPEALRNSDRMYAVTPRSHAVKPLSTTDNQPNFKENQDNFASAKIADGVQVKMKASEAKCSSKGTEPFSQLSREELINMLENQKDQLSQKDAKIMELEEYIDNLLVRVMEEKPSILMSLSSMK